MVIGFTILEFIIRFSQNLGVLNWDRLSSVIQRQHEAGTANEPKSSHGKGKKWRWYGKKNRTCGWHFFSFQQNPITCNMKQLSAGREKQAINLLLENTRVLVYHYFEHRWAKDLTRNHWLYFQLVKSNLEVGWFLKLCSFQAPCKRWNKSFYWDSMGLPLFSTFYETKSYFLIWKNYCCQVKITNTMSDAIN